MTDAPVLDPFGLRVHLGNLTKHGGPGNHPNGSPQSVHGGGGSGASDSGIAKPGEEGFDDERYWSLVHHGYSTSYAEHLAGGGQPYETGHVVGGDPAGRHHLRIGGDFRKEADPYRRFTEMWQRTFEGYDLVREAAQNVLDGEDALHEHSLYTMAEDGTWINEADGYTERDLETDITGAAQYVADGLRAAKPGKKPLFRGTAMAMSDVHRIAGMAKSGETFDLIPSSTSPKIETAQHYANGRIGATFDTGGVDVNGYPRTKTLDTRVVFRFPESTRRVHLSESDWADDHPEAIVAGRFKVAGVFSNAAAQRGMGIGSREPDFYVNLEPVEQP